MKTDPTPESVPTAYYTCANFFPSFMGNGSCKGRNYEPANGLFWFDGECPQGWFPEKAPGPAAGWYCSACWSGKPVPRNVALSDFLAGDDIPYGIILAVPTFLAVATFLARLLI